MFDPELIYKLVESGKPLPSKERLYQLFFKAMCEIEEMDFNSVKDLMNLNGSKFLQLKKAVYPKLCNPYGVKRAAKAGRKE